MSHYLLDTLLFGLLIVQYIAHKQLADKFEEFNYRANLHMAGLMTLQEKPEKQPGI